MRLFVVISALVFSYGSLVDGAPKACVLTSEPPDPSSGGCGVDESSDRFIGGATALIDQFPWVVAIEYEQDGRTNLLCAGTLISGKYVVTAAHCVVGLPNGTGTLTGVRLGDYDTSNDGPDCVIEIGGGTDCSEGAKVIPIEKVIAHPEFDSRSVSKYNDIALLKLKDTAPYTDFIRPICLPSKDFTWTDEHNNLWTSGWGFFNTTYKRSVIKQIASLPIVPSPKCQQLYSTLKTKIGPGQGCAGGNQNTCKGESGSPLMFKDTEYWTIVGFLSFGPRTCGQNGAPDIYTKVNEYLPWIREQMQN